jgi:hypothetical protein
LSASRRWLLAWAPASAGTKAPIEVAATVQTNIVRARREYVRAGGSCRMTDSPRIVALARPQAVICNSRDARIASRRNEIFERPKAIVTPIGLFEALT